MDETDSIHSNTKYRERGIWRERECEDVGADTIDIDHELNRYSLEIQRECQSSERTVRLNVLSTDK